MPLLNWKILSAHCYSLFWVKSLKSLIRFLRVGDFVHHLSISVANLYIHCGTMCALFQAHGRWILKFSKNLLSVKVLRSIFIGLIILHDVGATLPAVILHFSFSRKQTNVVIRIGHQACNTGLVIIHTAN